MYSNFKFSMHFSPQLLSLFTCFNVPFLAVNSHSPLFSLAGVSALAIALGCYHTCAIVNGGGVKCWGSNINGQLGIGSKTDATRPADVSGNGCLSWHLYRPAVSDGSSPQYVLVIWMSAIFDDVECFCVKLSVCDCICMSLWLFLCAKA